MIALSKKDMFKTKDFLGCSINPFDIIYSAIFLSSILAEFSIFENGISLISKAVSSVNRIEIVAWR